eukprot:5151391-Prymnesium_polylepis.5
MTFIPYSTGTREGGGENITSSQLDEKQDLLLYDPNPTQDSSNVMTSGAIHTTLGDYLLSSNNIVSPYTVSLNPSFAITTLETPMIKLTNAPVSDAINTFSRFKTTKDEILADLTNAPISCQSYIESGANAVIAATNGSGYHTLSPNGVIINTHLTTNYVPKNTTEVKVGSNAGATQNSGAIAIGNSAAASGTQGTEAIAIGKDAGTLNQGNYAVAIGVEAGYGTSTAQAQGSKAIAIGAQAGYTNQGANSICIGSNAGFGGAATNSIVLNGSGSTLNSTGAGFFVSPVLVVDQIGQVDYQPIYKFWPGITQLVRL